MSDILKAEGRIKVMKKDMKGFQLEDGGWYSGFNTIAAQKGDAVSIAFEQNGDFKNIKKVVVTPKIDGETPDKAVKCAKNGDFHLSPEQVRTNALTCALKSLPHIAVDHMVDDQQNVVNLVVSVAKMYEDYIWGEQDG